MIGSPRWLRTLTRSPGKSGVASSTAREEADDQRQRFKGQIGWGRTASRGSLNAEQAPGFGFFLNNWHQGSLITALYPSITLHLRPRIELGGRQIEEPAFTRQLMSEVMSWLTAKGFFAHHTTVETCGYEARLSCAATAFMNQALGKRGWLNMIFDKVVEDQRVPLMSKYLDRVVRRGNRLAAFCERGRASESADRSFSLQIN